MKSITSTIYMWVERRCFSSYVNIPNIIGLRMGSAKAWSLSDNASNTNQWNNTIINSIAVNHSESLLFTSRPYKMVLFPTLFGTGPLKEKGQDGLPK
jgi:hypothetical protein